MNRAEILAMKPGEEMDAAIAHRVMGWDVTSSNGYAGSDVVRVVRLQKMPWESGPKPGKTYDYTRLSSLCHLPLYSTDIAAAWEVVERLRSQGWVVRVQEAPDGFPWRQGGGDEPEQMVHRRAVCSLHWMRWEGIDSFRHDEFAYGATAPEAICKTAILATLEEQP